MENIDELFEGQIYGTYSIPILKERVKLLCEYANSHIDGRANAMYHQMCIIGQSLKIPADHPEVKVAEDIFQRAFKIMAVRYPDRLVHSDTDDDINLARRIMHATQKLQELIFAEYLK